MQENAIGDEIFDRYWSVPAKCHLLHDRLLKKNIKNERDIFLTNLLKRMPDVYEQLEASGWMCFAVILSWLTTW